MAKILVIEPDEAVRTTICKALSEAGHETFEVVGAGQALLHLEMGLPDLVLTELYMEGMDGIELIRVTRRKWPHLPVVTMTKGARPGASNTIEVARLLGASAFLDKPIADGRLVETLELALAS